MDYSALHIKAMGPHTWPDEFLRGSADIYATCTLVISQEQTMLASQSQFVAILVLVVLTAVNGQDDRRRSVTEHQLLHDRGRTIQSLKRLIWLSSAIEGLHTAQSRDVVDNDNNDFSRCCSNSPHQLIAQASRDSNGHKGVMESTFSDIFRPHITAVLPGPEK
ncbi:parathyroid hormone 4 [Alosa alosa]|nr:parathyroid hormone 4 [Alosa alosa]